ncbi:serine hydrolase [Chitinispirillales bacterium ANBcel5]|uniref:serine hydrolase domain-containing protein n=1 Tax=Cellulosispirillum alkaliphilum TaxID=3039283 RepID=UPI002A5051C8|nr:serine hydrolase [Chitinispirillales bacterium ANBcel5]
MSQQTINSITTNFKNLVTNDKKLKNAYLLVHSDKYNIHLNVAEGKTGSVDATPGQPNYLASVGKLFTSTVISVLYEKGKLDFEDTINNYLDSSIMDGLHVYKGKDYSNEITIKHLLKQTSGLYDCFYYMLRKISSNQEMKVTTRDALEWGKKNLKPKGKPGQKHFYSDTNYYLLGLIAETVQGEPFYKIVHRLLFDPLKMKHASMLGFSKPKTAPKDPIADFYIGNTNFKEVESYGQIDYAGGSVTAPLEEHLLFFKALVNHEIIKEETLNRMLNDDVPMGFPFVGINYGYGTWKFKTVPLLLSSKYNCWGCAGITGAFMFYHHRTDSYIIGTFNDSSYQRKAMSFMIYDVIKQLLKCE